VESRDFGVDLGAAFNAIGGRFSSQLRADLNTMRGRVLLEVGQRVTTEAVRITNARGLVDLGAYKIGWQTGGALRATPSGVEVVNDAPYAGVIEWGRRPGRPGPPLAPIREWVARKLARTGKVRPEQGETLDDAIDRVAMLIRNKLHARGSKPRYVLRDALADVGTFIADAAEIHLPTR
jgi:hypothetical protein